MARRNVGPDAPAGTPAAEGSPNFEQALERLETVVEELESGSLTLEDSIARYEEGMRLSRRLTQTLDEAEKRIERLVQSQGGEIGTEPIDLDAEPEPAPRAARASRPIASREPREPGEPPDELPF